MKVTVEPAFGSPVIIIDRADDGLNSSLAKLFLAMEEEKDLYKVENETKTVQVNIFESTMDLFNIDNESIQSIKKFCLTALNYIISELSTDELGPVSIDDYVVDAWFHITRKGGYISCHSHPMASWSGVYYVDSGLDELQQDDNGVLRFIDTRSSNMYQDKANAFLKRPFHSGSVNIPPKAGRLVLFPSFLQHEATPYRNDKHRICIAFNTTLSY